jgi:hypothetical protein
MIHWAQAAKLRISPMTSTTPIEWSIQSLEDGNQGLEEGNHGLEDGNQSLEYRNPVTDNVKLAVQIQTSEVEQLRQEVAEYRRNKVPKNQSLEDGNQGLEEGNQGSEDGNQSLEYRDHVTEYVKLAIQIQTSEVEQLRREVAEYRRNKVPKNDEKIHSAKETNNYDEDDDDDDDDDEQIHSAKKGLEEGNQGLEDGNQSLECRNPVTDNVKLAIQIKTSEVEQLRQEVAKYRRNKVPNNDEKIHSAKETNNYDEDDNDDDEQIHSAEKQNNYYDEDADIDNMILLFKVLMAAIVILIMFVGGIVGWEIHKSNRVPTQCIDEVIGDGLCDDRQNIAECRYDGNDCCLGQKNTTFCEDCACHLGRCSDCESKKKVIERLCLFLQISLP